ncbi:Peptidyl-prolyl cis-trans isomerase FKBP16-4, chloroplastic [Linum perenne]
MEISLFPNCSILLPSSSSSSSSSSATLISTRRSLTNKLPWPCSCSLSSSGESQEKQGRRRELIGYLVASAAGISLSDAANAVSTSRRAVPESEYTTLDNGLKYYDLKVGGGPEAVKGSRVAVRFVHYVAKWKGITFMTSRQGLGVGGGTLPTNSTLTSFDSLLMLLQPYGFDVGQSERGAVLKGLDLGVVGMRVGGQGLNRACRVGRTLLDCLPCVASNLSYLVQRLLIVPPELAYGSKGVQEIPPNATIEFDVELLAIKQSPFGSAVKVVEG